MATNLSPEEATQQGTIHSSLTSVLNSLPFRQALHELLDVQYEQDACSHGRLFQSPGDGKVNPYLCYVVFNITTALALPADPTFLIITVVRGRSGGLYELDLVYSSELSTWTSDRFRDALDWLVQESEHYPNRANLTVNESSYRGYWNLTLLPPTPGWRRASIQFPAVQQFSSSLQRLCSTHQYKGQP